uniref:Uncharacterized protein LOC114347680 n=1 Tax=Diabrotica virgifera virgifera TaxID=50390 RepID=A0A6P7GXF8_DIAVI
MTKYTEEYSKDPFSEVTAEIGERLQQILSASRQERWSETLSKMDMTHSSKQAWNMIKKLNGDPTEVKEPCAITPNQIAHQLLLNGKTNNRCKTPKIIRTQDQETTLLRNPFTIEELKNGIDCMKNGKSPGVDEILTEQIKHFGQKARQWVLDLFNSKSLKM